jgi:hypothetical protein
MRGIPVALTAALLSALLTATPVCAAENIQTDENTIIAISDMPQTAVLPAFLPLDVQSKTEDGVKLLVKTYEVSPDVEPQDLMESGLTRNGTEYILREVLREILPGSTEQRTAGQIVSVSSGSDKEADILPLLPESLDYSENGFTGQLTLEAGSISTEVESTRDYTYTISDSKEFTGLDRNDPAYIPKTSSKNGVNLTLADIQWTPGTAGNEQYPVYSATATYTGKGYGNAPNGYLVTARYSGTVEKVIPGNVRYSIIYEAVPVPIVPESFDWGKAGIISLWVIGGCGLLALGVVTVKKLGRLPGRKKAAIGGYREELESRPERRKPHALGYMRRDNFVE